MTDRIQLAALESRRDGLLREAEHIEKRLRAIVEEVTSIQAAMLPQFPVMCEADTDLCARCGMERRWSCNCDAGWLYGRAIKRPAPGGFPATGE